MIPMTLFSLVFAGLTAFLSSSVHAQAPAVEEVCKDVVRRFAAGQQAKAQLLTTVDIDPAMVSLRQLRAIIGEPGSVNRTDLALNLYMVHWLLVPIGGIEYAIDQCKNLGPNKTISDLFAPALRAGFLSSTGWNIDENAHPIEIMITPGFTGAVRGLRITDPASKIIELGSRSGFKPSSNNSIQISASWEVWWNLEGDPKNHFIKFEERGYTLVPVPYR